MTPEELVAFLLGDGYLAARVLPDGSVAALARLLFTRAIVTDCSATGYGNRFCFDDMELAVQRFAELQSADDEPQGYITRR